MRRWPPDDAEITVVDTTDPVPACPADIEVERTEPAGAVVDFAISATDACDAAPSVVADTPSGSTFPFGTTVVTVTATDATGNADTCTFEVTVLSVEQVLANLEAEIDRLYADGKIKKGIANAFERQLSGVPKQLDKGNTSPACSQLLGFIDHVQAQIDAGNLPPPTASR